MPAGAVVASTGDDLKGACFTERLRRDGIVAFVRHEADRAVGQPLQLVVPLDDLRPVGLPGGGRVGVERRDELIDVGLDRLAAALSASLAAR